MFRRWLHVLLIKAGSFTINVSRMLKYISRVPEDPQGWRPGTEPTLLPGTSQGIPGNFLRAPVSCKATWCSWCISVI